jgi:hypothetical protein
MRSHASPPNEIRTLAWAALSGALGLISLLPAAAVGTWLSDMAGGGDPVRLGLAAMFWTLLASSLSVGLAKVLLAESHFTRLTTLALVVLAGAAASGLAEGALIVWTVNKFRYPDPDYMGWSVLLPVVLAVLTSGVAASLVTVGPARALAIGTGTVGLAGLVFLVVDSAPGALDGIGPSGPVLALAFGIAAAYGALGTYILLRADIVPLR